MIKDLTKLSTKDLATISDTTVDELTTEQWWWYPDEEPRDLKAG